MRTMYVCFYADDESELEAYFDESFNLISIVPMNDANWRHGYFNPILEHFGLEVKDINPEDVPDFEEKMKKHFEN